MGNEKKAIKKKDWISSFNLIGRAKINDYTFKIDERSEKSNWIYNSLNLGVDCGEKYGTVYCSLMGGYSEINQNVIYAHGKADDGSDKFDEQVIVDWDDRFNDKVLENVGDLSFITIGLERTDKNKIYYKKFLSAYDAIAYTKDHLEDGAVVNVRGTLKYSIYNDKVKVEKNITSIALSKVEKESDFKAKFIQSILIDKYSASLKNVDKDKGVMYVDARVLDYSKDFKCQFPYNKQFESPMNLTNQAQCKAIMEKVFKVKKDITQITFEGEFIESGATVQVSWEDVPDDIKSLVELGYYSKEEVLTKCATNDSREQRMILTRPLFKSMGDNTIPMIQKFDERYTEDDLDVSYLFENEAKEELDELNELDDESSNGDDDELDWLKNL